MFILIIKFPKIKHKGKKAKTTLITEVRVMLIFFKFIFNLYKAKITVLV